jgi:hypothetical protein
METLMRGTYDTATEAEADREQHKAHRVYIEPTTIRGYRGQYYRVHYRGAPLIDETWNPEFEACRALWARGIVGRLEVWRLGKSHPDVLVPDIAKAAEWTVKENETRGPHFGRWQPRPEDPHRMPFPVLRRFYQRPFWHRATLPYPGKKPSLQHRGARRTPTAQNLKVSKSYSDQSSVEV